MIRTIEVVPIFSITRSIKVGIWLPTLQLVFGISFYGVVIFFSSVSLLVQITTRIILDKDYSSPHDNHFF